MTAARPLANDSGAVLKMLQDVAVSRITQIVVAAAAED